MSLITIEDGILKLDEVVLPCVVTSIDVGGKVLMDSSSVEGASGKKTVFNGFDDSLVKLSVVLLEKEDGGQERYQYLAQINNAFKCLDGANIKVYSIESALFEALNIENIIFSSLDVKDDNNDDSIRLNMSFKEWDAPIIREQEQAQAQEESKVQIRNEAQDEAQPNNVNTDNYVTPRPEPANIFTPEEMNRLKRESGNDKRI